MTIEIPKCRQKSIMRCYLIVIGKGMNLLAFSVLYGRASCTSLVADGEGRFHFYSILCRYENSSGQWNTTECGTGKLAVLASKCSKVLAWGIYCIMI